MKSALEKILSYKVKDGRVTSQSDKEQWTCLQKIIAINKLIVDYHNAFVELKESYQDLLDRYNEINAEWDVLKTDMEAIATEWAQFKPLVQQIINLWENTITPTFEEWTTLMNNWGNTMNGYSDTMADYEQQMLNIQQEFNEIETAWGNITLAVRGNFTLTTYTVPAGGSKYIDYEFDKVNELYVSVIGNNNSTIQMYPIAGEPIYLSANVTDPLSMLVGMRYLGNFSETNSLYQFIGTNQIRGMFTDFTDTKIRLGIENIKATTPLTVSVYTRHVPYFSVDQSAEVQEALTKANEALTTATNAQSSASSAMSAAQQALTDAGTANTKATNALTQCGQLESSKLSNHIVDCITTDMTTLAETRSYALKVTDPDKFLYVEGLPNTNSGYLCCSIPFSSIPVTTGTGTSGGKRYQLTDEANYFSFTIAFNDITATLYITFSTRAQTGAKITRVALYG